MAEDKTKMDIQTEQPPLQLNQEQQIAETEEAVMEEANSDQEGLGFVDQRAKNEAQDVRNPEDQHNYQFYKEYCRLYYANIILTNRLQQLLNEKKDL